MRFRVTNIRPGYCEVWANERDGDRYTWIALVKHLSNGWQWHATGPYILPKGLLPDTNKSTQSTRRECVIDCKRTALIRQMEHAIARQPKESKHWHSPRRDALADMERSHLFTSNELEQWEMKSCTFGEVSWVGKKGRELLRGRPLSDDCYRATCSDVEYIRDGIEYCGCYGLMDWPENFNDECKSCGAFVDNLSLDEEES